MGIQTTTAGRNSEYKGELCIHSTKSGSLVHLPVKTGVFPYKDHSNIPAPAVVEFKRAVRRRAVVSKQIRIGMLKVEKIGTTIYNIARSSIF